LEAKEEGAPVVNALSIALPVACICEETVLAVLATF
jgi:hypothetical protein